MSTNRFDTKRLPIEFAPSVASVLWPRFVQEAGCIFVSLDEAFLSTDESDKPGVPWRDLDRTGIESVENKVDVLDLFKHARNVWDQRRKRYRRRHPHFRTAQTLAVVMAQTWFAKLRDEFPSDAFRVYYTGTGNVTVRFHRIYEGEPVWLDEKNFEHELARGRILVLDTRK